MNILYTWFTLAAYRSWYAHGLIVCAWVALWSFIAHLMLWDALYVAALASSVSGAFYAVREASDEVKHRKKGDWNRGEWLDGVKPRADKFGDLCGPVVVMVCLWGMVATRTLASWLYRIVQ